MDENDKLFAEAIRLEEARISRKMEMPRLRCAELKARFKDQVQQVREEIQGIEARRGEVDETIRKSRAAGFGGDQTVAHCISQLHAITGAVSNLHAVIREYERLAPEDFLSPTGEYNHNAVNYKFSRFSNGLGAGNGCIKHIENRLGELRFRCQKLMEGREYNARVAEGKW